MDAYEKRSILCPNCRRLISTDEMVCPHCNLRRPGSRWRTFFPARSLMDGDLLIRNIIYLNAGLFVLSILMSPSGLGLSMNPFDFLSPDSRSLLLLGATGTVPIDEFHRWWTVLSANFLHASIMHILFNMMALRQIAPLIIQEYGTYRTISIFILSGVGGYVVSYFAGVPFTLGASAAVCGLIGAALFYGKSRGGYFGQTIFQQVGGWAIGIFVFGFLFPGINNWAHGGGLAGGILAGFLLGYRDRSAESFFHKTLASACVVASLGALLWSVGSAILLLLFAGGR